MKFISLLTGVATLLTGASAVTGAAEGFAKGVTGGGSATPVYPNDIKELVAYLKDNQPRVVVLTKTYVE